MASATKACLLVLLIVAAAMSAAPSAEAQLLNLLGIQINNPRLPNVVVTLTCSGTQIASVRTSSAGLATIILNTSQISLANLNSCSVTANTLVGNVQLSGISVGSTLNAVVTTVTAVLS